MYILFTFFKREEFFIGSFNIRTINGLFMELGDMYFCFIFFVQT